MKKLPFASLLSFLLLASTFLLAQKSLLQSGPMLGYSDMMETMLWAQTTTNAKVQVAYWPKGQPKERLLTDAVSTQKESGFTAHLLADQVQPGKRYEYELRINDQPIKPNYPLEFQTQPLWQWRTDPPTFRVAMGSCAYVNEEAYDRPGKPYGGDYQIFTSIHQQRPDLMLWLGDNTYLREVDWFTRTGFIHRYTHSRSLAELQPLLASTHHYAIWDDHDFGPNDSDRSFIHKDMATEIFGHFWANPKVGLPGLGGCTSYFQWSDIDFFLLDDRYFRTPNKRKTGDQTILGEAQIEWLIDALAASNAPFKIVAIGGQVLTTYAGHETYMNIAPAERELLLGKIEDEGIKNVVFLTGDRHHTELSMMKNRAGNTVYDLTVSPLTSGVHTGAEANALRVAGTMVQQKNFGVLEFSGPTKARVMKMSIFDSNGKEVWVRTVTSEP
ncbi:MAG: alkaline phosphatase family protein [Saprospiraceae bacterium]|nr:alkaline phosphatase family protein [Saprospiraceae bacterium]